MLILISILSALLILGFTFAVCFAGKCGCDWCRRIPRNRTLGLAVGLLVLCWGARDGAAMLPASYTPWCWAAVPAAALLCHFFLDYTAARSLGGIMVMLANYMIQHAFAEDVCCRILYGGVSLIWGLLGICVIAWPWWLRDALEFFRSPRPPGIKAAVCTAGVLSALILILLPIL